MTRSRTSVAVTAVLTLLLTLLLPQPSTATATPARPDLLPGCVYGSPTRALQGYEARVQRDAWAYADRLRDVTAPERLQAARTFAAAETAYVYGLPLVNLHDTVRRFRLRNSIISIGGLATPESRGVVSPNVDTAYTVGWLSLTQGPLVIDVPDTRGRFYTVQFMDAYTNSFSYVGSGATGTRAGSFLLVPPGWEGTAPEGVRVVRSPTNTVWLLGRTLVDDAADAQRVRPILRGFRATPLAAWRTGVRGLSVVLDEQPEMDKAPTPTGTDFIATLNQELTIDPPPAAERCVLRALAPAGVEPPDSSPLAVQAADAANALGNPRGSDADTPTNAAIAAGTRAATTLIDDFYDRFNTLSARGGRGWSLLTDPWIGDFGTKYLARGVVATNFLGANIPRIAIYPTSYTDGRGRALSGRHRYTITFRRDQLPPVKAFWSLTMYQRDNFLYANQIDRYAVGDRARGLRYGKDGSLTLYLQHARPKGALRRANWLPAPAGSFHLILRMYLPEPRVFAGRYAIPPVVRR